jgi:hypothetical protein
MKVIPEIRGVDKIRYTMYTFLLQNSKYTLNANNTPNFKYKITNNKKNDIDRFDLHSLDLCQLTSFLSGNSQYPIFSSTKFCIPLAKTVSSIQLKFQYAFILFCRFFRVSVLKVNIHFFFKFMFKMNFDTENSNKNLNLFLLKSNYLFFATVKCAGVVYKKIQQTK